MKNQSTRPILITWFSNKYFYLLTSMLVSFISADAQNITLRSQLYYPSAGNANVWGYSAGGREYALVGIYEGLSIVDVSDPDNPVEIVQVPTATSEWHEIKTWDHYAYVSNESGGGILIVDLINLPGPVTYSYFTDPANINLSTVHTLWIDEQGYLYLFGSNFSNGGADIYNLNPDPENPVYITSYNPTGEYDADYIHDGFVRGDTLWAAHVYGGTLEVVDMSDKLNPVALTSFFTPSFFTHNCWPTHDNHYLFTTDEVDNSFLASYDVSDLSNVTLLDKAQSHPGSNAVVHNVHLYNDSFAVAAYYTEGVVIFDVTYPDNMIKIGQYDTSPTSGGGYSGDWGAYPYLPSGTLLASDRQEGLFVLTPEYTHAAWLFGTITDSLTSGLINNAEVNVISTENEVFSNLSGEYKTGAGATGFYDISFSKPGYATKVINVYLESGIYDTLHVVLVPLPTFAYQGQVLDSVSQLPVAFADVEIVDSLFTFMATTDASGNFSFSAFYEGTYEIFAGKWGFHTKHYGSYPINSSSAPITILMSSGYYDDFSTELGWTEAGDASLGKWVRAEPQGTDFYGFQANPDVDVSNDYGAKCFVTGNFGTEFYEDPVFEGVTELRSPAFDISQYTNPYLDYYTWFYNVTSNFPANTLYVYLKNGQDSVLLQSIKFSNTQPGTWVHQHIRVKDFMTPSSNMSIHFFAENPLTSFNLFECGVDKFQIYDSLEVGIEDGEALSTVLHAFPNPFSDQFTVYYEVQASDVAGSEILLLSMEGRIITSAKLDDKHGTLSFIEPSLPAGVYFVQLRNKGRATKTVMMAKE